MKREILKKTLIYRTLAYIVSLLIGILTPMPITISVLFVTASESASLGLYYIYELIWRKLTRLRKGQNLFLISEDRSSWYNVLEVLEDNKFIIEVV